MKKLKRGACALFAVVLVLSVCACGNGTGNTESSAVEEITLTEEDEELLETIGDDINVVDADDFSDIVSSLDEENVGEVYQLVGYYLGMTSEDEETDYLCSDANDPDTVIQMRYLTTELTEGEQYTVTAVVAQEEHGDHSHIVLDIVTVESYAGK